MDFTPPGLSDCAACAPSLPADQDRTEVRILASLVTLGFAISIFEPIFYLWLVPQSLVSRVATLAPSIWCVTAAFGLSLLAVLPHLFWLAVRPAHLSIRWPRVWAAFGGLGAAATWIYLANLATPMDLGSVEWAYVLRAVGSVVIALTYGFSLNAQQLRSYLDDSVD